MVVIDEKRIRKFVYARMAEALIEQLLRDLDCDVVRNGIENGFPMGKNIPEKNSVRDDLCKRHDFVVFDKKGTPYYIEVKFRGKERKEDEDTVASYPQDTVIVIVKPTGLFGCRKEDFPKNSKQFIALVPPFNQNVDLVAKYGAICKRVFN